MPPKALLLAQTEHYIEYSRTGKIIKGAEKPIVRSRFEEDVYPSNHQSVWGSYWKDGQWGFSCCHSTIKNSYCTGERGKDIDEPVLPSSSSSAVVAVPALMPSTSHQALAVSRGKIPGDGDDDDDDDDDDEANESPDDDDDQPMKKKKKKVVPLVPEKTEEELEEERQAREKSDKRRQKKRDRKKRRQEKKSKKKQQRKRHSSTSSSSDSSDSSSTERKLSKALKKEEDHRRQADRLLSMDERKRPYNSMKEEQAPTEVDMEAYYMKRKRDEDPMAAFM